MTILRRRFGKAGRSGLSASRVVGVRNPALGMWWGADADQALVASEWPSFTSGVPDAAGAVTTKLGNGEHEKPHNGGLYDFTNSEAVAELDSGGTTWASPAPWATGTHRCVATVSPSGGGCALSVMPKDGINVGAGDTLRAEMYASLAFQTNVYAYTFIVLTSGGYLRTLISSIATGNFNAQSSYYAPGDTWYLGTLRQRQSGSVFTEPVRYQVEMYGNDSPPRVWAGENPVRDNLALDPEWPAQFPGFDSVTVRYCGFHTWSNTSSAQTIWAMRYLLNAPFSAS